MHAISRPNYLNGTHTNTYVEDYGQSIQNPYFLLFSTIEKYYMGCKIQNFKSKIQLAILFIANFPFTVWLLPVAKLSPKFIGGCENGQIMLAIQ